MARHVFRDRRLADLDPELEEFAVNPRGTPERIIAGHLPVEIVDFLGDLPSSRPSRTAFPSPVESESSSVPSNDGVRLDDG